MCGILKFFPFVLPIKQCEIKRQEKEREKEIGTFEGVTRSNSSAVFGCLQSTQENKTDHYLKTKRTHGKEFRIQEQRSIDRKKKLTGSAKPGLVIHRVVDRGEINPFGGVNVLVQIVLYESPLNILPVNFCWFHYWTREDG